ncbi:MAG TPA: alpha-hydroxy acid oxidase [Vicinamibacteria bacterium]|nr:alpha-hydroxy acid oxidase [Vicinamibacteria bacterium]
MYRRELIRFLLASPLGVGAAAARFNGQEYLIESPDEALSVFDFHELSKSKLPPAHYGYLATGVDDDLTLRANREAFSRIQILARRLVDVSQVDLSIELFGTRWETPIVLAPVGSQRAFHPEGEVAVARAARQKAHLQILSTMTTASVEEVTRARGGPVWYQLYPTASWKVTEALVRRAEAAGCPALVLTVDLPVISNRETAAKMARTDSRQCSTCHEEGPTYFQLRRKPMFDGLDLTGLTDLDAPALTWDFIPRLKQITSMKVLIKGIVTAADAKLAVESGADGVIVSNHGGRAEESGRATIDSLPQIVEAVESRVPVLVDSGFRRGTDIFKALALGAKAVCVGRPYIWGLASFGQPGVESVLAILRNELALAMRLAGTTSIDAITRDYVRIA